MFGPGNAGGSHCPQVAGHSWVLAKGWGVALTLFLVVVKHMVSKAPGCSEALTTALMFISVAFGTLGIMWWQYRAVDLETLWESGAIISIAASFYWG